MIMHTFTGLTQYKPVFVDPPDIPEITLKDLRNKVKNKTIPCCYIFPSWTGKLRLMPVDAEVPG
jgi:hypothetical protein